MKPFISFLLIYLIVIPTFSQTDGIDVSIEKLIEDYMETRDDESFDYLNQVENLEEISKRPFNINKVTSQELDNLFFLSSSQKNAIIDHRLNFGDFIALEELQTISNLDNQTVRLLKNFLTIEPAFSNFAFSDIMSNLKHTVFLKAKRVLQDRAGYLPDEKGSKDYLGDPNYYLLRYRIDGGSNLKAGFIAENDPGEYFFKNKKGFDYYSGYVFINNPIRFIHSIALGDYAVSMGQGLILNNNFSTGKSAYVMNFKRDGKALKPYNSVNESNLFRGAAVDFKLHPNVNLVAFYSTKKIDGTLQNDTFDLENFESFSSIIRSGYHRTENELSKKGSISQNNFGTKIGYHKNRFKISGNYLQYEFSNKLLRDDQLYNLFAFSGDKLSIASIDYSYIYKNANVFGEYARSDNGGTAMIHSVLMPIDRKIDIALSYRKYDANYQILEANAFGEASLPINEEGLYFGLETRLNNSWKLSTYADFWKSPWAKFGVDGPSKGKEYLIRAEYNIKRKLNVYIQYRYEGKYANSSLNNEKIDYIVPTTQHRARIQINHKVNKELELRSRAEYSFYEKDQNLSEGYHIYQDIIYKPTGKPFSFSTRYAIFDTDDFNSRIYSYENDLQYEFAVPFYYNKGKRFYINTKWRLAKNIAWELRYSITSYQNIDQISSGTELINGKNKSEVKTQLRFTF